MHKRRSTDGVLQVLDRAIKNILEQADSGDVKGSYSDLVRLVQLRKEMGGSESGQVTVRWVDECQTPASEE